MNEQAKNEFLSDYYSGLKNIMKRLYDFSQDKGKENFNDIEGDFKTLQANFQEFSFGLDPHEKEMQRLTGMLEKTEELFKKVDQMLPL